MDFELSDERRMLADTLGRWLAERYPFERRMAAAAGQDGFDGAAWLELAELGAVGALVPPEAGGFGGTGEDLLVVFGALGRALSVEPFLATGALGAWPVARTGGDLGDVIAGETRLALAYLEPGRRFDPMPSETSAELTCGGWRLSGAKVHVVNGDSADNFVVSARCGGSDDVGLFLVAGGAEDVSCRGHATVDGGRAAEVRFEGVEALPLGTPGGGRDLLEDTLARGCVAVAAEAVAIMDVCREMTLEHLKTRVQFGRPIGANQVLQHRMVELTLEIEQARSALMLAASALDGPRDARERAVSAAKHLAGRVGQKVAEEAIQMHGGIAMTWEHPLPHYAKRLVMLDHLLGDSDHHLERFAALGGR